MPDSNALEAKAVGRLSVADGIINLIEVNLSLAADGRASDRQTLIFIADLVELYRRSSCNEV